MERIFSGYGKRESEKGKIYSAAQEEMEDTKMNDYEIKRVDKKTVEEYVRVNVLAWQQCYKGIVNDDFLKMRCSEEDIRKTIKRVKKYLPHAYRCFLLEVGGRSQGMMSIGVSGTEGYTDAGEINALYLLEEVKKQGYGRLLFERAVRELKDMGFNKMVVTCLQENPSNGFYRHMGGRLERVQEWEIPGQILRENIYFFEKI